MREAMCGTRKLRAGETRADTRVDGGDQRTPIFQTVISWNSSPGLSTVDGNAG
jgi:hypothetical protein